MKKIFLSTLVVSGLLAAVTVFADTATVYVSPASGQQAAGSTLNATVVVNPAGNQACVVSGTVLFTNLNCSSIALASGLVAQTTPTCANPSFTIGIPKCTTAAQNLFSITATETSAGTANIGLSSVKVIGEGTDVASTTQAGSYTVTAASVPQATPAKPMAVKASQPAKTAAVSPAQPATPTPAVNTTAVELPVSPAAASASGAAGNFVQSPIFVGIVALILGILAGMWFSERRRPKAN